MTEKKTSEVMRDIAVHYFCKGCNDCDFYKVAKVCDAVPLNCAWMRLCAKFEVLEETEDQEE